MLESLTMEELRAKARKHALQGYSRLRKAELIKLIRKNRAERKAGKEPKRSPPKQEVKRVPKTPMTMQEIKESLPVSADNDYVHIGNTKAEIQKYYGQKAQKLTFKIANKMTLGTKVYTLIGQSFSFVPKRVSDRILKIDTMTIRGWADDKHLTVKVSKYGDEFEIYKHGENMVFGSGAEPVYVFVK